MEWMSHGISPTQRNRPLLKLHSGRSVGQTCFNETHRQHAWEKERQRQCIRKLCSHPCRSLLWKGSNKHVLQIFTQSEAHVFSSHTHAEYSPGASICHGDFNSLLGMKELSISPQRSVSTCSTPAEQSGPSWTRKMTCNVNILQPTYWVASQRFGIITF